MVALESKQILVELGADSYPILIKAGLLDQAGLELQAIYRGKKVFILTDHHVNAFYGAWLERSLSEAGYLTKLLVLPAGEATKSLTTLPKIYDALADFQMNRQDLLLTLGGGVIGDLGGFAAATYLRGIPFIQMPTSLLAQVDSSVGGKVGVDLPQGKNLVGSFYQPKAVLIDPQLLETLPERYFRDGMAEVIKYGCIANPALFEKLRSLANRHEVMNNLSDIILACCQTKKAFVEADERDRGARLQLNFGHTLGHGIEAVENYQGHSHGEAVAIGMLAITRYSEAQGLTEIGTSQQLEELLKQHGLPTKLPKLEKQQLVKAIALDKKNLDNSLNAILLKKIGESYIYPTKPEFFEAVIQ